MISYNEYTEQLQKSYQMGRFCESGDINQIRCMIQDGNDINIEDPEGGTVCELAIRLNRLDIVKLFIYTGLDKLNSQLGIHESYLSIAVYYQNIEMIKLFLDNGAQINIPSVPILCAYNGGSSLEILKLLVTYGADLNADHFLGQTALQETLFIACKYSDLNTIKYLISIGADIHKTNKKDTMTCLLHACYSGNLDVVKFLISQNVDTNHISKYGNSTMDKNKNNQKVIEFFIHDNVFNVDNKNNGFHDIPFNVALFL